MTVNLSPDVLSVREIRRRLTALDDATCHLRSSRQMPIGNPWNREVMLTDIAVYIGMSYKGSRGGSRGADLRLMVREEAPPSCPFDCRRLEVCKKSPPCRNISGVLQQKLSDCLKGLEAGTIRKVRQADGWRLVDFPKVPMHAPLAKMVTPQGPPAEARSLTGRIELTPDGPRLKL
jgi:hypothetical protein